MSDLALVDLAEAYARLFPYGDDMPRLVDLSGVDKTRIRFSSKAIDTWISFLGVAHLERKLLQFIGATENECRGDDEWVRARNAYVAEVGRSSTLTIIDTVDLTAREIPSGFQSRLSEESLSAMRQVYSEFREQFARSMPRAGESHGTASARMTLLKLYRVKVDRLLAQLDDFPRFAAQQSMSQVFNLQDLKSRTRDLLDRYTALLDQLSGEPIGAPIELDEVESYRSVGNELVISLRKLYEVASDLSAG